MGVVRAAAVRGGRVSLLGGRSVRAPRTGLILAIPRPGVRARWGLGGGERWVARPERPRHPPSSNARPPRAPPGGWWMGMMGGSGGVLPGFWASRWASEGGLLAQRPRLMRSASRGHALREGLLLCFRGCAGVFGGPGAEADFAVFDGDVQLNALAASFFQDLWQLFAQT